MIDSTELWNMVDALKETQQQRLDKAARAALKGMLAYSGTFRDKEDRPIDGSDRFAKAAYTMARAMERERAEGMGLDPDSWKEAP